MEYTVIWAWFQHSSEYNFYSYDCSWSLLCSMNVCYYLFWRCCLGSTNLSLHCYGLAREKTWKPLFGLFTWSIAMLWLAEAAGWLAAQHPLQTDHYRFYCITRKKSGDALLIYLFNFDIQTWMHACHVPETTECWMIHTTPDFSVYIIHPMHVCWM